MAGASPMTGALAATAFADGVNGADGEDGDTPEPDVKIQDTSASRLNPSDPASIAAYTKKINALMARLDQTPDEQQHARFEAWAGGLNDPSGNGSLASGIVNAAKSESDYDLKDRALRAQYTPLIVNALTQQQQFAAQQKILNQPGGIPSLVGMPIDQAQRLSVALPGFNIMQNWKLANPSGVVKGGSYKEVPASGGGMTREFFPDPTKNITVQPNGTATVIPNAPEINAATTGSHALANQQGKNLGGITEVTSPTGATYKIPTTSAIPALATTANPFLNGLEQYAGQSNPPKAANGPLNHPEQQPPAQTPQPPQGQGQPPAAPGARPTPPGTPPNPNVPAQVPGAGPTPPAIQQTPNPQDNIRGNFNMANPRATIQAIAQIPDPQERANAFKAFMQQRQAQKQPAFQPGNGVAPQLNAAPGAQSPQGAAPTVVTPPPAVDANGIPTGAAQTGLSAAQTRVNSNMTAYNKQFMDTTLPQIQQLGGQAADETIQAINTGQKAMSDLKGTGWGTAMKAKAANIAAALGYPGAGDYATNAQEFQKAIQQQNLQTLRGQKGAQSDNDSKNVAEAYAALGSTPEANQYIFDVARAIQERNKLKAQFYTNGVGSVNQHNNGDMSMIDQKWYNDAPGILQMPSMQKYSAAYKKAGIAGY